jgi:GNAT superfamily N-acetyltransferase
MKIQSWRQIDFLCTTDKSHLQRELIHDFLFNRSYWAKGRTIDQVNKSINHSLCFGIYKNKQQVAFARVVTDFTVYAYILDVFVLEDYRGLGLGKFLMNCIMNHPELQELKRWMLGTENAHGLYEQYGFTGLKKVQNHMEKVKP